MEKWDKKQGKILLPYSFFTSYGVPFNHLDMEVFPFRDFRVAFWGSRGVVKPRQKYGQVHCPRQSCSPIHIIYIVIAMLKYII